MPPKTPRKRMGPNERAAARARWADIGTRLLGDVADLEVTPNEVSGLVVEAIELIAAITRDRRDADDTPDAEEG